MRIRLSMYQVARMKKETYLFFIRSTMVKTKSGMSFTLLNLKERTIRPSTKNMVSTQVEISSSYLQCLTIESLSLTPTTNLSLKTQLLEPQVRR
jgi:hypothetical protein